MGAKYNLYLFCPEKKILCRMQLCIRVLQQSNKPPKGWTHHLKASCYMDTVRIQLGAAPAMPRPYGEADEEAAS